MKSRQGDDKMADVYKDRTIEDVDEVNDEDEDESEHDESISGGGEGFRTTECHRNDLHGQPPMR